MWFVIKKIQFCPISPKTLCIVNMQFRKSNLRACLFFQMAENSFMEPIAVKKSTDAVIR